jgi:hypothetical protein
MILMSVRRLPAALACSFLAVGLAPALAQQPQRPPAQTPAKPAPAKPVQPAAAKPEPAKPSAAPANQARPGAASNPQKPAAPAAKPAAAPPAPGGMPATLIATFGDWGVYAAQAGRSKICYALSQPKDRLPKNLSRDPAYMFVSFRPGENVKNEVALVLGFPTKENGPAEAATGTATYALLTKEQNAWLKNPAEEGQAITVMGRSQSLTVKAQSRKGNQLTDRYSLNGFGQALDRARKECS